MGQRTEELVARTEVQPPMGYRFIRQFQETAPHLSGEVRVASRPQPLSQPRSQRQRPAVGPRNEGSPVGHLDDIDTPPHPLHVLGTNRRPAHRVERVRKVDDAFPRTDEFNGLLNIAAARYGIAHEQADDLSLGTGHLHPRDDARQ